MKKETVITVTGTELVLDFLKTHIGKEPLKKLENTTGGINIRWRIKEHGDVDKGNYFQDVEEAVITLSENTDTMS